jgi:hypothetical protein
MRRAGYIIQTKVRLTRRTKMGLIQSYTATLVISNMRRFIHFGILLAFAAAGLSLLGALFLAKDRVPEFWSSFLLNVAAELLGLGITALVAVIVAKQKLDDWVPRLVNLIANLRGDNKINGPTARSAVICAVQIFSEERFLRTRPSLSVLTNDKNCKVCLMDAETEPLPNNSVRCKHCLLPSDIWGNTAV